MSQGADPIETLVSDAGRGSGRKNRRNARGWVIAAWIVGGLAVLLAVAFFLTDSLVRSSAESVAEAEIQQQLPDGVTGQVNVSIGGGPVLIQYLGGSFENITLTAPKLMVDGVPANVTVVAHGLSTDLSKPVSEIRGTVALSQDAINQTLKIPGVTGPITLGDGTVSFTGSRSFLGLAIGYSVTATPSLSGPNVLFKPTSAKLTSGPVGLDATGIVNAILGQNPVPVCVASYLPKGVTVRSLTISPESAVIGFDAHNITLSRDALSTKGSCS